MDADSPCAAIAIRLADEGVPLRAIARATEIPSAALYETLVAAKISGQLLALPRDDWPPGCPRDQRSLQLSRLIMKDHDSLVLAVQNLFDLTPMPARLLILLVQHEQVPHARIDVDHKSFGVHVCRMRKAMQPYKIRIRTIWGFGYRLLPADRKRVLQLILTGDGVGGSAEAERMLGLI